MAIAAIVASGAATASGGQTAADGDAAAAPVQRNWRAEADARIEQHRKSDFVLTVQGPEGEPLSGVELDARQTRSAFHFGMAVNGQPWQRDDETERRYADWILAHFNTVVCENHMKWYANEPRRGEITYERGDRFLRWADEHRLAMRGHCLFWAKPHWVQDWIHQLSNDELREAMDRRLAGIVPRYAGRVIAWDVNNEMITGRFFADRLGEEIRPWMFRRAAELDPRTPLHVNEYGILCNDAKLQRYIDLIKYLQENGAPVGGIGIQEHAVQRMDPTVPHNLDYEEARGGGTLDPWGIWRRLDRLAEFGLPIHLTEVTSDTPDPQRRADTLEAFLRVCYAHPQVDAFLLWGFWAGRHFRGANAALVDRDWTVNAAGERIARLLLEEWRTQAQLRTDPAGRTTFRGFHGTYRITATDADGRMLEASVELTKDQPRATVTLRAAGDE